MGVHLRGSVAAGVVLGLTGLLGLPAPAQAAEWYNEYTVHGLPPFITTAMPFEVTVDGPDPVCGMTHLGVTLTAAPWVFTAPVDGGYDSKDVDVDLCADADGYTESDWFDLDYAPVFDIPSVILSDGWADRTVTVGNNSASPAVVTVQDGRGRVVARADLPAAVSDPDSYRAPVSEVSVTVPTKGVRTTTRYTVTATAADGTSMSAPLVVAKGWSMMGFGRDFAPCSTVEWSYDPTGAPNAARTVEKDIRGSLKRLAAVTGLTFVKVPVARTEGEDANVIPFAWQKMGRNGPSATGGTSGVRLNSEDYWPLDKYAGFGNRYRSPAGRGWLIVHEVMHVLGLDHVNDRTAIMSPINYGQHSFAPGDLQGLRTLYPRTGCPR